jgi:hypothetical protein
MSSDEQWQGILTKVTKLKNEDLNTLCKRILKENGLKEDKKCYDDAIEQIQYDIDEKYIVYKDDVYLINKKDITDDGDCFIKFSKNNNGSINFHTRFYNGGTCLSEMIKDGLEDYLKKHKGE